MDRYIEKEIQMGAIIGPFESIPFKCPVAISPISTRPKKESVDRRIILDCSWPIGASLNDGLDKFTDLGEPIKLKYPTIDDLARRIFEMKEAEPDLDIYMFKEDLDRAFRQLRRDIKSIPLLGYKWGVNTSLTWLWLWDAPWLHISVSRPRTWSLMCSDQCHTLC